MQILKQDQFDDFDDDVEDDKESDYEVVLDIIENEYVVFVVDEVSSFLVLVEELYEDEKEESEDEGEIGDIVGGEFDEKGIVKFDYDYYVLYIFREEEVCCDDSDNDSGEL